MNFGNILKNFDVNKKPLIKVYFVIVSFVILAVFFTYIFGFQKQAAREALIVTDLVSQYLYNIDKDDLGDIIERYIVFEVLPKIENSIIITDINNIPQIWRNIDINENLKYNDMSQAQKSTIEKRIIKMQKGGHQIPLRHPDDSSTLLGWIFYEDSQVIRRLKVLPFIELVLILFFLLTGLYALSLMKKNEKRKIWVGLAKETAHQFGTPISSLIGWIDLLKMKTENIGDGNEIHELLDDMTSDVELLKKVASRFGKVGSNIRLQSVNIDNMINSCTDYFQKRLPHFNQQINIKYIANCPNRVMMLEYELFTWALENIIKNAIDAMKYKSGNIVIYSECENERYYIRISDDGKGMAKSMFKKIFEPGITTKERGWGLGLSLAKRIVEEYHDGKIKVLESTIDIGTTIEIEMPIKPHNE